MLLLSREEGHALGSGGGGVDLMVHVFTAVYIFIQKIKLSERVY